MGEPLIGEVLPTKTKKKNPSGRRRGIQKQSTVIRTEELANKIKKEYPDYDPVLAMVAIAVNAENDAGIRLAANKEVASYVRPKLKAIAISVEEQNHEDLLDELE